MINRIPYTQARHANGKYEILDLTNSNEIYKTRSLTFPGLLRFYANIVDDIHLSELETGIIPIRTPYNEE